MSLLAGKKVQLCVWNQILMKTIMYPRPSIWKGIVRELKSVVFGYKIFNTSMSVSAQCSCKFDPVLPRHSVYWLSSVFFNSFFVLLVVIISFD